MADLTKIEGPMSDDAMEAATLHVAAIKRCMAECGAVSGPACQCWAEARAAIDAFLSRAAQDAEGVVERLWNPMRLAPHGNLHEPVAERDMRDAADTILAMQAEIERKDAALRAVIDNSKVIERPVGGQLQHIRNLAKAALNVGKKP